MQETCWGIELKDVYLWPISHRNTKWKEQPKLPQQHLCVGLLSVIELPQTEHYVLTKNIGTADRLQNVWNMIVKNCSEAFEIIVHFIRSDGLN